MTSPDWPPGPPDGAGPGAGPPPGATAKPWPGAGGPSTSAGRRRRRRGRGRYLAVAVVLLALTAGVVIWAPWRKPPLLRPTGLAAGASTASSVAFHWSGPATGPSPDRYLILHDGKVISSVPGTITSFRSTDLAPDSAYQYRVAAVRGGKRSALSAVLTVNTKAPPVSAARWQGRWTVDIRITKGAEALRGQGPKGWTEAWQASPQCPTGPCTVRLTGELNRKAFKATLTRAGAVYTGTTTANLFPYRRHGAVGQPGLARGYLDRPDDDLQPLHLHQHVLLQRLPPDDGDLRELLSEPATGAAGTGASGRRPS